MGYKSYCVVSGTLFAIVALAHLVRVINGWPVQVDTWSVPMLASWIGLIVPGCLAVWAYATAGRSER